MQGIRGDTTLTENCIGHHCMVAGLTARYIAVEAAEKASLLLVLSIPIFGAASGIGQVVSSTLDSTNIRSRFRDRAQSLSQLQLLETWSPLSRWLRRPIQKMDSRMNDNANTSSIGGCPSTNIQFTT